MSPALRHAAPYLAYGFVSLVGLSSRFRWQGREHELGLRRAGKPFIYAFWHQRQVAFTYTHRGVGAHVLVSRSRDGEIIAKTMELSRIGAVRGSSSRGAAGAARELLEKLRSGQAVGITPDGPRGPARTVKEGVLFLAQRAGVPILPLTSAASRRIELARSWDRFHIPLPLSRIGIWYAPPIFVSAADELAAKGAELKAALDRITDEADRWAAGA